MIKTTKISTFLLISVMLFSLTALSKSDKKVNRAMTPGEVVSNLELFFAKKDVDAMMSLYREDSVMVSKSGFETVTGLDSIHSILEGFANNGENVKITLRTLYQNGNTALVIVDWSLNSRNENGNVIKISGTATDVLKQDVDGSWYYLIDNPYGIAE